MLGVVGCCRNKTRKMARVIMMMMMRKLMMVAKMGQLLKVLVGGCGGSHFLHSPRV